MAFPTLAHYSLSIDSLVNMLETATLVEQADVATAGVYYVKTEPGHRHLVVMQSDQAIAIDVNALR